MLETRRKNLTRWKLSDVISEKTPEKNEIKLCDVVNAGLWFDKFISGQDDKGEKDKDKVKPKQQLISDLAERDENLSIKLSEIYKQFFISRWKESLESNGAKFKPFKLDGSMVVGLGGESVLETSITLHRIYGVPYIPGSALKGLAASYAHKHLGPDWKKGSKFHSLVFGSQDSAGLVTFHDALLIPKTDKLPLHNEVMTVHHSDYYGDNNKPPADWDSPIPVPLLSASGEYLLALSTEPGLENIIEKTFGILELALSEEGIGAKTSSGYGRGHFELSEEGIAADKEAGEVERFTQRVNAIRGNLVAGEIGKFVDEWNKSEFSVASRKQMAQAIINKVNLDWKNGKQKLWYQKMVDFIGQNN